jgi:adenylosuccinate lyase
MASVAELVTGYGPDFPTLEELFGLEPTEEQKLRLSQPTPELGRYFKSTARLEQVTSQRAVARTRFYVMIEYVIALSDALTAYNGIHKDRRIVHSLSPEVKEWLRGLGRSDADIIRAEAIEKFADHDTAAAGDYLKLLIGTQRPDLEPMIDAIHFAKTSEDAMGPVFGLVGNSLVYGHFVPALLNFMEWVLDFADCVEADGPLVLPGFTHEQAAEPTTFGKKITTILTVVAHHLWRMQNRDGTFIPFTGKFGGAIGNLTTHYAAYPDIDWRAFARSFIEGLGLTYEEMTFQASLYSVEVSLLGEIGHILTHLAKLAEDFIGLASCPAQLFVKRKVLGGKGSSIMPGKSNAWGMEGAVVMLLDSRSQLRFLCDQLPDYPHEGNMGRSYLFRTLGRAFMPAFIALDRTGNEMVGDMDKRGYAPNLRKIAAFLNEYPGMAGSTIQTVLKREGTPGDAYRLIQRIAINPDGSYADAAQFAEGLERVMEELHLPADLREELRAKVIPANNTGIAADLAKHAQLGLRAQIALFRSLLERHQKPLI